MPGMCTSPQDEAELSLARQKAKEFHEKWVVGYGHASVAEHAVAHVAVEDVSIIASKVIEDTRLAAYTEKSTRYVPFARAYYEAPELGGEAGRIYRSSLEELFDLYERLLPAVTARIAETADRSQFKTERGYLNSCQAQACDALRYLLPAATHTNIGITANARTLEHLISKMLSHPLVEVRDTGERIKTEATKVIPTLIKYARPRDYWTETPPAMRALLTELLGLGGAHGDRQDVRNRPGSELGASRSSGPVTLVRAPEDAEARLAAAILYEYAADEPYERIWDRVRKLPGAEQRRVIGEYLKRRRTYGDPAHGYTDPPLRALEHCYYTFEILVDYGAYRDIQRHRMATQTSQRLHCGEGFDVPELLERCGLGREFSDAMGRAADAHSALAGDHPEEAQ